MEVLCIIIIFSFRDQATSSSENNSISDQPTVSSPEVGTPTTSKIDTPEIAEAGDASKNLVGSSKAANSSTIPTAENDSWSHGHGENGDATNKILGNGISDINENRDYSAADNEYSRGNKLASRSVNESNSNKTLEAVPQAWRDSAIQYHLRSPLDADPPEDWVTLESEFVWVTAVYLSHLGNEMAGVPAATLDDDVIYIYTLRYGIVSFPYIFTL